MDEKTYKLISEDYPGNRAEDVKNPGLLWMMGFIFAVSFLGLFSLVPLRKVSSLGKYLSISFIWSCFKWFFSGVGDSCGFDNFPSFGLTLFKNTFYFDFCPTYVGCGLICPHIVNCSVLLGPIVSWGLLWSFISTRAGDWYPDGLRSNDFKGLYDYKLKSMQHMRIDEAAALQSTENCNCGSSQRPMYNDYQHLACPVQKSSLTCSLRKPISLSRFRRSVSL